LNPPYLRGNESAVVSILSKYSAKKRNELPQKAVPKKVSPDEKMVSAVCWATLDT